MAITNGSRTVAWVAILITGMGAASTTTFVLTKAAIDTTGQRLTRIEEALSKVDGKIDSKMAEFTKELSFRVDKANEEHKAYDLRLDRLEHKVGKL